MSAASHRKMKPSGVDWIGDVPEGWGVVRVKYTGWYRNGLTYAPDDVCDEDEGVLVLRSSNIQGGKLDYADSVYVNKTIPRELMTRVDDIVICSRNGSSDLIGKNAIVNDKQVMTFGAFMMTYRVESYFPRFAYWMLNSCVFKYYRSLFATSTVNQLTGADFGNITVPVPPLDEQKRIAAKLDRLCGRVDELAENLKGEIAALQEYRKSLITECVTKGLNPKAKMKPSSVDWIGDIPEGWTVASLKYLFSLSRGVDLTQDEFIDGNIPVCGSNGVMGYHNKATQHGPVVTIGRSGSVGKINYFEQDCWVHNTAISVVDARANNLRYIYYCLLSFDVSDLATKTAVPTLDRKNVENYKWVYTQDVAEQSEIAAFLDKRCAVIDAKIAERQKQLEKLGEYRSSVIYEYVTGKREVSA